MSNNVMINSVGPISGSFSIDLSSGPGLYELSGSKGTGKSTALDAIDLISGHKTTITVHDGELAGSIEGFGVIIPIGSRKKKRGACSVDYLDSEKFNLVDLIDPPYKTAITRDAQRIKAMASLSGLELKPEDFYQLGPKAIAPEEDQEHQAKWFESLGVKHTDDPVLFASRVKETIDIDARKQESIADNEDGHAKGLAEQFNGLDLDAPSDVVELNNAASQAAVMLATTEQSRNTYQRSVRDSEAASDSIGKQKRRYQGLSVEKAESNRKYAVLAVEELSRQITELHIAMAEMETNLTVASGQVELAEKQKESAVTHHENIAAWGKTIQECANMDAVTEDEIKESGRVLKVAREQQENGVRIRDAIRAKVRHDAHVESAEVARKQAESLRATGRIVWDVLASKLQTNVVKIESIDGDPRLIVEHPERGKCFFDKVNGLSDGERVRTVIDELMPRIASPGLLALPQRVFQDLPPADRLQLAAYAEEKGLYLFGAQVDDGELSVRKVEVDTVATK